MPTALSSTFPGPITSTGPRHRRILDKLGMAFDTACDCGDLATADRLVQAMEIIVVRRPSAGDNRRRHNLEMLIKCHERLWLLRHDPVPDMAATPHDTDA